MARTGIVVGQMGGPGNVDEVEPFIRAIFADPEMVPIPGPPRLGAAFGHMVAKIRGPRLRAEYRSIGGGSPILAITTRQAQLLDQELGRRGHDVATAVAMRYSRPDTLDAVRQLADLDVDRVLILPLYPQYSFATTASSEKALRRALARLAPSLPLTVVRSWHDHPSYLDLQAQLVVEMLDAAPTAEHHPTSLVFSAHSIPRRMVDEGDPYPQEVERSIAEVVDRIPRSVEARLAYQSRRGPVAWIGPGTDEVLRELAASGCRSVAVVPISFVSDHIETLHEIDVSLRRVALQAGIESYRRCEVFNDRPEVGPMLADLIDEHL